MQTLLATKRDAVTIRPIQIGDVVAFRELRLEALCTHPEAFGADYADSRDRPAEFWEQRVRSGAGTDHSITYVAEAGGALVGMTGIFRQDGAKMEHSATIWGVYVQPAWRGAGLADALMEACLAWARERALRLVKLAVVTTNTAAIRCYVRCGFSVYGLEPEVIFSNGSYHDELLMVRRLVGEKEQSDARS